MQAEHRERPRPWRTAGETTASSTRCNARSPRRGDEIDAAARAASPSWRPAEGHGDANYDRLTGLARREVLVDRLDHCMLRSARTSEQFAVLVLRPRRLQARQRRVRARGRRRGARRGRRPAPAPGAPVRHRRPLRRRRVRDPARGHPGRATVALGDRAAHRRRDLASRSRCPTPRRRSASASVSRSPSRATTCAGGAARARRRRDVRGEARGKGRVELFGPDLDLRLTERRELGNDLRFALERGELELWYRPVASLDTGCIASLEGSVRWNHPTRGVLAARDVHPDRVRDRA